MASFPTDKTLTSRPVSKKMNFPEKLALASRVKGVSPLHIAAEIVRRRVGPQKLTSEDYLRYALFRPDLTAAQRDAFVCENEARRLSTALRSNDLSTVTGLLRSKVLTELVMRGAGLSCARSVALAARDEMALPFPVLRGAAAIETFLRGDAVLPLFGKPANGSLGIGAASFMAIAGDDLLLGDGTSVSLPTMCSEIARDYPDGYLFQPLLRPHPDLAALIGPVIGTLRVLMLRLKHGLEPLYSVLKIPAPGAMMDGALGIRNSLAWADLGTGKILRAQMSGGLIGSDLVHSTATGARLPGATLPDWAPALALARDAFSLFPTQGILGLDVMLTDQGPVVTEANANPFASLYQKASGQGLFNEPFKMHFRESVGVQGVSLPLKGVRL